jgi:hypothetical protein
LTNIKKPIKKIKKLYAGTKRGAILTFDIEEFLGL